MAMIPDWASLLAADREPVRLAPTLTPVGTSPTTGKATAPAPAPSPGGGAFLPPENLDRFVLPGTNLGLDPAARADLDSRPPRAWVDDSGTPGADLVYTYFDLERGRGVVLGSGPATRPGSAEDCLRFTQTESLGAGVSKGDLAPGAAFCLSTGDGSVAWLKLMRIRDQRSRSSSLEFEVAVWHRR
ncbi:hypothetical protein [Micromonospora mirobrigensis]|uniref:hypothetical protein n=1 Tax=Micromonospora mirobrigensis TaxID=262898 RepID=UPI001C401666|nr:hypothetical protein [Micromonospora mirobrigensis]